MALNRAYAMIEPRRWYWLRLGSIGYTLIAAVTSLAMAFLIVLGPLIIEAVRRHIPLVVETNETVPQCLSRYGITIAAMIAALFILLAWLPAGRRSFVARSCRASSSTLVASLRCRASCSDSTWHASPTITSRCMPASASVIIALVFLYFIAAIFVFGGELNAAIIKSQLPRGVSLQAAQSLLQSHLDSREA